ncbi:TolB-like translocation protein [Flavobacterium humi]|uniref:PD40 domain-containing protein n=1 Tax=Flavobacterium humi TaxID=2562683 RepID=UPI00146DB4E3|nr:PD40 domain-containing protein [Flavobacterium humi]
MNWIFFIFLSVNCFSQNKAQLFEPETISKNDVFGLTISPNGEEAFWVHSNGGRDTLTIMQSKKIKGQWQQPEVASFSANRNWKNIDPMFSPDGKTLYFQSNRPVEGKPARKGFDIYAVKKTKNNWSEAYRLDDTLNTDASESFVSLTKNGSVYFTKENPDGKGKTDIYRSKFENGQFQAHENIGLPINTSDREANPYIDKNGKYIIYFSSKAEGNFGDVDLYISFNKNGTWSTPKNLGPEINTIEGEFCPFYHEKEKKLYFSRTKVLPNGRRVEKIYSIPFDAEQYKV